MDHRYLRYFIAVAEELSFTRAAEKLHTVQPSLSQQIRRLEEIVGTPLFLRQKHRLQLSEAGRIFLQEARSILQYTDRAIELARQAARAEAGLMTMGLIPGVEAKIFPRVLPVLRVKYPDIELAFRSLTSPQQLQALQDGAINVGFMRPPIDDPEIATELVLNEKILAILPANHHLAKLKRIPVRALSAVPFLEVSKNTAPLLHDTAKKIAEAAGVNFNSILPGDNVLMSLSEVASGLGFCLLPDNVVQILPANVVARHLDCDPEPEFPLIVAYRRDDRLPALAFFLSLIREHFGSSGTTQGGSTSD